MTTDTPPPIGAAILIQPAGAELVIPRSDPGYAPRRATPTTSCADVIWRRIQSGNLKTARVAEELRIEEPGPDVVASCDPDGLLFVNINTPHDYERARQLSRPGAKSMRDRIMDVSNRP